MAVCRVERNRNYTTMSNYHLRDPCLSNKARGLLSTMLSLPEKWDYAKEGTIYPILYRLQEAELIQCRLAPAAANGGLKKYYSLTPKGKEVLQELIMFWSSYTDCVNSFIAAYQ